MSVIASTVGFRIRRASSASRSSINAVELAMSAKRTVIIFRSPSCEPRTRSIRCCGVLIWEEPSDVALSISIARPDHKAAGAVQHGLGRPRDQRGIRVNYSTIAMAARTAFPIRHTNGPPRLSAPIVLRADTCQIGSLKNNQRRLCRTRHHTNSCRSSELYTECCGTLSARDWFGSVALPQNKRGQLRAMIATAVNTILGRGRICASISLLRNEALTDRGLGM